MTAVRPRSTGPLHPTDPAASDIRGQVAELRRRTETVFDQTLSAMFDAMDGLGRAEAALRILADTFAPPALARLRAHQEAFGGLAVEVEAKVARSRDAAARLERLIRAGGGRLDDLRRLTRTAALVALNAQVVSGAIRADGGALDGLARTMRAALGQVSGLVAELEQGLARGGADLRRVQDGAVALRAFADREAIPAIRRFAAMIEARARDKALARSAALVSGRLVGLQDRIRVVVTHLQVGDSVRQRFEHVETILTASEEGGPVPPALLRRLAAAQMRAALGELSLGLHEGRRCLRGLGRTAGTLPEAAAVGTLGGEGGLAPLVRGAAGIERAIDGLSEIGHSLSEASQGLARTLAGVGRATGTAAEFERRMTVLGLNAILLSSRLGTEGRAMVEVAQQLRDIARSTTEVIAALRRDTEGIAATAQGLDVPEDQALARHLIAAGGATQEVAVMARAVGEQLEAMGALRAGSDIAGAFWRSERALGEFGARALALEAAAAWLESGDPPPASLPAGAEEALAAIRRIYTMQAERDLHDALCTGGPASPRDTAEDERDVMLFA